MIVYTPLSIHGYELCHPINEADFETINKQINGEHRQTTWKPISAKIITKDQGQKLVLSDSPWLGSHALIFRSSAIEILGEILKKHGELLDLHCTGADISIYNPTMVLDALDESESSVLRFENGRLMRINRYALRDVIKGVHIFKIPNLRVSPTFVSDCFVESWKSSGLKGLEFKKVWKQTRA